jgi:hypothetical protein
VTLLADRVHVVEQQLRIGAGMGGVAGLAALLERRVDGLALEGLPVVAAEAQVLVVLLEQRGGAGGVRPVTGKARLPALERGMNDRRG